MPQLSYPHMKIAAEWDRPRLALNCVCLFNNNLGPQTLQNADLSDISLRKMICFILNDLIILQEDIIAGRRDCPVLETTMQ